MTGDLGSPFAKDFAKAILMAASDRASRHRLAPGACPGEGRGPPAKHVVGQNDPGIDPKGRPQARPADRLPQRLDMRHQQIGAAIEQVQSKKAGPAWNSIAAILGHEASMPCI